MIRKHLPFIIFICFLSLKGSSQRDAALEMIHDLCSDKMSGRGYVDQGHLNAARYIQQKFSELNLSSFEKGNYLQPFNISVHTFPSSLHVSLDGRGLKQGVDFLIDPVSGSAKGKFKLTDEYNFPLKQIKPGTLLAGLERTFNTKWDQILLKTNLSTLVKRLLCQSI